MSAEYDAMVRLSTEDKIPLKRAGSLIIGNPSFRTLQRYVHKGYRCPMTDRVITLEAFRSVGRCLWTSRQAVQRFCARINGAD